MSKKSANIEAQTQEAVEEITKPIEKYVPECESEIVSLKAQDKSNITIKVKPFIPFDDVEVFVNYVVLGVLNSGEVTHFVKDFLIRLATIRFYTDVDIPDDADKQYCLSCCTDLVEKIREHIDDRQYQSILSSIEQQLQYETQRRLYDLKEEAEKVFEVLNSFGQIFSGVSPDQLQDTLKKINEAANSQELINFFAKRSDTKPKRKSGKSSDSKVVNLKPDGNV